MIALQLGEVGRAVAGGRTQNLDETNAILHFS